MNITELPTWKKLTQQAQNLKKTHLRDLFNQDPKRAENFHIEDLDLFIPHQANLRISQFVQHKLKLSDDRSITTSCRMEIQQLHRLLSP